MNDLKLRAWDPIGKVMLDYFTLMQSAFNCQSIADQHQATYNYTPLLYKVMTNPNMPKMLFTGRQDSKGKDVYQSDILGFKSDKRAPGGGHFSGTMAFHPANCSAVTWDDRGWWRVDSGKLSEEIYYYKLEKIGNIYENPELLVEPVKHAET